MSPFDAIRKVTHSHDCQTARVNRYGIGFGQRGYWGNEHFPSLGLAEAAFEVHLIDLRRVYGTPGHNWTGQFIEEEVALPPKVLTLRSVRFIPLRKDGKRGKTIHTVQLYRIDV